METPEKSGRLEEAQQLVVLFFLKSLCDAGEDVVHVLPAHRSFFVVTNSVERQEIKGFRGLGFLFPENRSRLFDEILRKLEAEKIIAIYHDHGNEVMEFDSMARPRIADMIAEGIRDIDPLDVNLLTGAGRQGAAFYKNRFRKGITRRDYEL